MTDQRRPPIFSPTAAGRGAAQGAPDATAAAAGELRVGYVHRDALCWTFFHYHLQMKASSLDITVLDRPASTLPEQVAEIDGLLREGIDLLMLRPIASDNAELLSTLRRVQQAGVQIIALDGSVGGGLEVTTVGVDNRAGQAGVAQFLCRRLQGQGRIAHLQGNQNMEAGRLRSLGLHEVLARYPGIDLVHEADLDWGSSVPLGEQGAALARAALAAHPDLAAIVTTSDEAAFGVGDVLRELGLQGRVLVTGFDALPEALIAIDDGRMDASAYQPLEKMAERALHDAVRLVRQQPGVAIQTRLAGATISRENLHDASLRALRLFPSVISELEQRRRQQQASTAFLETLVDNLPHMLLVKEAESLTVVRNNRAADDWLGVPPGSQLGKTAFDLFPAAIAERFHASDREVLAGGRLLTIDEEESHLPGHGQRFVRTQKTPIFDIFGQPAFLMILSEDITERKLIETALAEHARELETAIESLGANREKLVAAEKMAALGSLVAGVAHELNTPIGNGLIAASTLVDSTCGLTDAFIGGLSRTMLSDYLAEALDNADILGRNLRRAADLINSFKQISIDQAGTTSRRFSLSTVVAEVVLTLWPTIRKTPFTVRQSVADDIIMDSYPGALEQVLINLINNALIHGLEGRASGQVTISAQLAGHGAVSLVVEDDGRGIPADQLDKVFAPFFTTRADAGGSGLGLNITHTIVTGLLGGEIELTSRPGAGARFCLTLPLTAKAAY